MYGSAGRGYCNASWRTLSHRALAASRAVLVDGARSRPSSSVTLKPASPCFVLTAMSVCTVKHNAQEAFTAVLIFLVVAGRICRVRKQ